MSTGNFGNFTVFGFTKDQEGFLKHHLRDRLGIVPRTLDFGSAGHFFFYTSNGDVAETEEAIGLTLGFGRSLTNAPLSTQQLLRQHILQPDSIDSSVWQGNALVACFGKHKPIFCVYQTMMMPLPLYYARLEEGILCTTDMRCLLALLERVQINDDVVPMHFLFAFPIGPLTYFHDVWRLCPGQMLKWDDGRLSVSRVRGLRPADHATRIERFSSSSIEVWYERMSRVMSTYMAAIDDSGYHSGNLLSGGVDSSLLQLLINDQSATATHPVSFSYAVQAESFEFEVEYARRASQLFNTQHSFLDVLPQDFPELLNRTVDILAQPNLYVEAIPCHLALAEFLASNVPEVQYLFFGQGADALYGIGEAKKIALFERARRFPGSRLAFRWGAAVLATFSERKSHGLGEVAKMLAAAEDSADSPTPNPYSPTNYVAVIGGFDMARRCFGDEALQKAFDYRLGLEAEYLDSTSLMEKIHAIDLVTNSYEAATAINQLFAAQSKELIPFYLDEEVIKIASVFSPEIRFLKGSHTKPLPKQILARRSFSELAARRKGASVFSSDLYDWMKQGLLRDMVHAIDVPDFMSKPDFDQALEKPDTFLWRLLTFDIFQKRVLKH